MFKACPSAAQFVEVADKLGYKVFKRPRTGTSEFNLNIVGWRSLNRLTDSFSDYIALYWQTSTGWKRRFWRVTTLPGSPWLLNPMSKDGTAVLVPGQYLEAYRLGIFKGYKALVQVKPVKVYRDNTKDMQIDLSSATIETGLFGINIHKAGLWSKFVGNSSAGCQVFQRSADFAEFIRFCESARIVWGNSFSYTLIDEAQI